MKKVKFWIRNYFGFSRTETNGFVILVTIMIVLTFVPRLIKVFATQPAYSTVEDERILDSLLALLEQSQQAEIQPADSLFTFDPNEVSRSELTLLGVGKRVSNNIINYRSKGGQFRIKGDFKKIYGLSDSAYKKLEPYLRLPERSAAKPSRQQKVIKEGVPQIVKFDLNTADTVLLKSIRGIGSVLSARIIKFRDKLGGFVAVEQLSEIYGLKPEALSKLEAMIYISENFEPTPLAINSANIQDLASHPYINWNLARVIYSYRLQHGNYKSIEDFSKLELVNDSLVSRLSPYLSW